MADARLATHRRWAAIQKLPDIHNPFQPAMRLNECLLMLTDKDALNVRKWVVDLLTGVLTSDCHLTVISPGIIRHSRSDQPGDYPTFSQKRTFLFRLSIEFICPASVETQVIATPLFSLSAPNRSRSAQLLSLLATRRCHRDPKTTPQPKPFEKPFESRLLKQFKHLNY